MGGSRGTVVEELSHDPKFQGLNPGDAVAVIDKMVQKW